MRPHTFFGLIGIAVAVLGGVLVNEMTADQSPVFLVPVIVGLLMMAGAWLVRWRDY